MERIVKRNAEMKGDSPTSNGRHTKTNERNRTNKRRRPTKIDFNAAITSDFCLKTHSNLSTEMEDGENKMLSDSSRV